MKLVVTLLVPLIIPSKLCKRSFGRFVDLPNARMYDSIPVSFIDHVRQTFRLIFFFVSQCHWIFGICIRATYYAYETKCQRRR